MKKIMSILLAVAMIFSIGVTNAFATTDYTNGTEVIYSNPNAKEEYTVTVPALMAPGETSSVVVAGTWASNRELHVTADTTVMLKNSLNPIEIKTLNVTFAGITMVGNNTVAISGTEEGAYNSIKVADLTDALFGTWTGAFYYSVEMVDVI